VRLLQRFSNERGLLTSRAATIFGVVLEWIGF
jgi:hypothetical protein